MDTDEGAEQELFKLEATDELALQRILRGVGRKALSDVERNYIAAYEDAVNDGWAIGHDDIDTEDPMFTHYAWPYSTVIHHR